MIVIVMGVSGSGKTTIGKHLAITLGWLFLDGDDFHPPANIAKMRQGIPLTDGDRWPWLDRLRQDLEQLLAQGQSAVVACSALKQRYRDRLQGPDGTRIRFVYLHGHPDYLRSRLRQRQGHFMAADMLDSQLATLEVPQDAILVEVDDSVSVAVAVNRICTQLGSLEDVRGA